MGINNTGSARDVILIIIVLFVMSIGTFAIHFMFNNTLDKMLEVPIINSSNSTREVLQAGQNISNRFDYIIFSIFIGMILALMITSWFIGGNPIFMFIYFLFIIIGTVLSAVFSNIWSDVATSSVFGANIIHFPLTNYILTWLPIYSAVIGILGLIIMFAKPFIAQEG